MMATGIQTREDIRKAFDAAGLTVSGWADTKGFRRESVYAVLAGRTKGRRGEAHRIAQALGLKAEPSSRVVRLLCEQAGAADDVCGREESPMG